MPLSSLHRVSHPCHSTRSDGGQNCAAGPAIVESLKGPSDMTGSRIGDDFLLLIVFLPRANPSVDEAVWPFSSAVECEPLFLRCMFSLVAFLFSD